MKRNNLLIALCDVIRENKYDIDIADKQCYKPIQKSINKFVAIIDREIKDSRKSYLIRYPLNEIIIMCFFGLIQNAETYNEIANYGRDNIAFLKKFAPFTNGACSHDTVRRVFEFIDYKELTKVFVIFITDALAKARKYYNKELTKYTHLIGDGKWLRGSGRLHQTDQEKPNFASFNVYDAGAEITIFNARYDKKESEIGIAQEFFKQAKLDQTVVSMDALHCQRETVKIITKRHGEYVIALKENQPDFYHDISQNFSKYHQQEGTYLKSELEKNHNQIEKREYFMIDAMHYYKHKSWSGLNKIVRLKKTITNVHTNKVTIEERYYITSLGDIEDAAYYIRAHWRIENNLHWNLDVNMKEDRSLISNKNAAMNFSALRKICLTFLKLLRGALNDKTSLKRTRKRLGWAPDKMMLTLFIALSDDELLSKLSLKE